MQVYGWYHWLHGGKNHGTLEDSTLTSRERLLWPSVAVLGTFAWGYMMATYTDAAVPFGDAFTTVASLMPNG